VKPQLQLPATRVWRRELALPGKILVAPGGTVQPDTVVGECDTPAAPAVIDLDRAAATVSVGQQVQAGEVVARRKKLLGRGDEIRVSVAGTVLGVSGAELLLQPPALTAKLYAQLPGSIAAVRGSWGVDVEGCFAIVSGHMRIPRDEYGLLGEQIAVVVEPLTVGHLQTLSSHGMRAVIAPSWSEDSEPPALPEGETLPVFLTEMMPRKAMAAPIAEILQQHLGRPAAIQAGPVPQLAFRAEFATEAQCFGSGSWVRTADGRVGRLASVGQRPRFFPSGLRAVGAEVDLGDRTETLAVDSLEWIA